MAVIYWTNEESGQVRGLTFDATLREEITQAARPTEFPVETGATISDHVQPEQLGLTLELFVSNTPTVELNSELPDGVIDSAPLSGGSVRSLDLPLATRRQVSPLDPTQGVVQGVAGLPSQRLVLAGTAFREGFGATGRGANTLQFDDPPNRVAVVFEQLRTLVETSQALNVITGLTRANPDEAGRTLENMFITNLSAPRDPQSGSGVVFNLTLRQLLLVSIEFGQGRTAPTPADPGNKPKTNTGNKSTAEAPATFPHMPGFKPAYWLNR